MNQNKTTNSTSRVMDLRQLIAAPLVATVDADALSTKKYLDHLFTVAFEPDENDKNLPGKLRYISFNYKEGNKIRTISLPLMSLVPLPLLQVKEAEFNFDINIVDSVVTQAEKSFQIRQPAEGDSEDEEQEFALRATLATQSQTSSEKSSSSMRANMKVKVVMQQADIPGGLTNLLQLTNNSIQINEHDDDQPK